MAKLIHTILCNVSRRYRARHCRHVDELPRRIQRKLLASCQETDPRSWRSAREMFADLDRELDDEAPANVPDYRKVAVFA